MPGQYDLQNNFPVASVADLIANRPVKENNARVQQQQQLLQGLQSFGEGVQSLVQRRNQMAQALTLGKNLGMAPEEVQGLTPDQVVHAAAIRKGNVDMNMLMTLLHPNATTPNAGTTVSGPAGQVPPASTGGPMLTSNTTVTPMPDQGANATPAPAPSAPASSSMPVPIQAPPVKLPPVNAATMHAAITMANQTRPESVFTNNNGQITKVGEVPKGSRFLTEKNPGEISLKEDQFYQREWDKLLKESDPLNASSRTPLGLASRANFQANRALQTLSKPIVTNQEAGNAMADMAAIYQNGSPTQFGMSHQAYETLYGKIQGLVQSISGKPTDALPDAIKSRLVGVLNDMKGTNQALLKQRLDMTEHSKKAVISHFPQEWKEYREILEGNQDQYNGLNQQPVQPSSNQPSGLTPQEKQRMLMLMEKKKNGSLGI